MIKLEYFCSEDDFKSEVVSVSGKSWDEVEKAFSKHYMDSEGLVSYISADSSCIEVEEIDDEMWLREAVLKILKDLGVKSFNYAFDGG